MFTKLRQIAIAFKKEVTLYQLVLKDSRTPPAAKFFLGLAVGYLLLPFDIIPDFIPVFGQLDDILIVPGLVFFALKFIPKDVIDSCRRKNEL